MPILMWINIFLKNLLDIKSEEMPDKNTVHVIVVELHSFFICFGY